MHRVSIPACQVVQAGGRFSVRLPEDAREAAQKVFKFCSDHRGGFVRLTLVPPGRPRTTGQGSQSAHLHGHLQSIAVHTGQPIEDVKKFIKGRAVSRGYPMLTDEKGDPILDLWGNPQGISESEATTEQAALLIEETHQLAAEFGCSLIEGDDDAN